MLNRDRLLLLDRFVWFLNRSNFCFQGLGLCFLCVCLYVFVALPKSLQGKSVSCLFEDKLNDPPQFEVWKTRSRTKIQSVDIDESHSKISLQDTEFVKNKPEKEGFKFVFNLCIFSVYCLPISYKAKTKPTRDQFLYWS